MSTVAGMFSRWAFRVRAQTRVSMPPHSARPLLWGTRGFCNVNLRNWVLVFVVSAAEEHGRVTLAGIFFQSPIYCGVTAVEANVFFDKKMLLLLLLWPCNSIPVDEIAAADKTPAAPRKKTRVSVRRALHSRFHGSPLSSSQAWPPLDPPPPSLPVSVLDGVASGARFAAT